MKDTKRALRRHHSDRIKRKVVQQLKSKLWLRTEIDFKSSPAVYRLSREEHEAKIRKMACLRAQNRQPCSCVMCGNPRRHFNEVTLQELRAPLPEFEDQS